jgi:hypothetical protein
LTSQVPQALLAAMEAPFETEQSWLTDTQKGAVGEAVVATGLILASKGRLAPFKPVADDDGIDLLIYDKVSRQSIPLQIKCRTSIDASTKGTVEFNVRQSAFKEGCGIFILAGLLDGCVVKSLWLVPPEEFWTKALRKPDKLVMVASPKKDANDKWRQFRHDDLVSAANQIGQYLTSGSAQAAATLSRTGSLSD